uniref:Putative tail tube protein n=1 Tax=viral metagenome TaxID=1070528 RepID=A0A6M3IP09_9ZZZZ
MTIDVNLNKSNPSNFELVFPKIPTETTIQASDELTLNIYGTIIPGLTLDSTEHRWMGGKSIQAGGNIAFEPWTVNFLVDSQMLNWMLIFGWLMFIHNNKDKYSEIHKNYVIDATLRITDNFRSEVMRLVFRDIWPTTLGEMTFSHREGEAVLECMCQFAYDRFELID